MAKFVSSSLKRRKNTQEKKLVEIGLFIKVIDTKRYLFLIIKVV